MKPLVAHRVVPLSPTRQNLLIYNLKKKKKKCFEPLTIVSAQNKGESSPGNQALLVIQGCFLCRWLHEHVLQCILRPLLQVEASDQEHVTLKLNVVKCGLLLSKNVVAVLEVGLDGRGATSNRTRSRLYNLGDGRNQCKEPVALLLHLLYYYWSLLI